MPSRKPGALLPREIAILECLTEGELHGFAISALTEQPKSTCYNALVRLEASGHVRSRWQPPSPATHQHARRIYKLTAKGRRAIGG